MFGMATALLTPNATSTGMFLPAPFIQVAMETPEVQKESSPAPFVVPEVPFYSQFKNIQSPKWQKVGCGVTSLAMIISYYKPDAVSVNALLGKGVAQGAYDKNAGWTYAGLIKLSQEYGLDGDFYDLKELSSKEALDQFRKYSNGGPVIASVHYKFDPTNPIPHLVVINGILGDIVYYNDPASQEGGKQISADDFLKAWKKRFVVMRPRIVPQALI